MCLRRRTMLKSSLVRARVFAAIPRDGLCFTFAALHSGAAVLQFCNLAKSGVFSDDVAESRWKEGISHHE